MSHLEEHTTIKSLLSLSDSELKAISVQSPVIKKEDNILLLQSDIDYNNHKGYVSINYDTNKKTVVNITLDIDFARPAGSYNYPDLLKLGDKYMRISII